MPNNLSRNSTAGSYRESLLQRITQIDRAILFLPSESPLRSAWHDVVTGETRNRVAAASEADLAGLKLPPLFGLLDGMSPNAIKALSDDLDIIHEHSSGGLDPLTAVSSKTPMEDRKWCGALFELYIKSVALKHLHGTSLDYLLPNGKNIDVSTELDGAQVFIECTVITDSDEDRTKFDQFMQNRAQDSAAVLAGSSNPYHDTLRMYCKVYDKLAPGFDDVKSQTSQNHGNILFVSFFTPRGPMSVDSLGIGWALDELLIDQPAGHIRLTSCPGGINGISLQDWLDFKQLQDSGAMLEVPRRLGAISLFRECSLHKSRINYNADRENAVTHAQIARLEELFSARPIWWSR